MKQDKIFEQQDALKNYFDEIYNKHQTQIANLESDKLDLKSQISMLKWCLSVILETGPSDSLELNLEVVKNYLEKSDWATKWEDRL